MFVPKAHRVPRVSPPAHAPVSAPADRLLDVAEQQQQAADDDSGKIAAYLALADKVLEPQAAEPKKSLPARPIDSAA